MIGPAFPGMASADKGPAQSNGPGAPKPIEGAGSAKGSGPAEGKGNGIDAALHTSPAADQLEAALADLQRQNQALDIVGVEGAMPGNGAMSRPQYLLAPGPIRVKKAMSSLGAKVSAMFGGIFGRRHPAEAGLKSSFKVIENGKELMRVGDKEVVQEAVAYVERYVRENLYTPEGKHVILNPGLRETLMRLSDDDARAESLLAALEKLVPSQVVKNRERAFMLGFLTTAFGASAVGIGTLGVFSNNDAIPSLVGSLVSMVIFLFYSEEFGSFRASPMGRSYYKMLQTPGSYLNDYEFYTQTRSLIRRVQKDYQQLHTEQMRVQIAEKWRRTKARKIKSEFYGGNPPLQIRDMASLLLKPKDTFEAGMEKLLEMKDRDVQVRARDILERLIHLEALESARKGDWDSIFKLAQHVALSVQGIPEKEREPLIRKVQDALRQRLKHFGLADEKFFRELEVAIESYRRAERDIQAKESELAGAPPGPQ